MKLVKRRFTASRTSWAAFAMLAAACVAWPPSAWADVAAISHDANAPSDASVQGTGDVLTPNEPQPLAEIPSSGSVLQQTFDHEAMSTLFQFTLYARPEDSSTAEIARIAQEAFDAVDSLESRVSNWIPDSQLSYVNNHAHEEPVRVAYDVFGLVQWAQQVYTDTRGAFDMTVGPLIALWGFYKGQGHLPTDAELVSVLADVGMDKVVLNAKDMTISFKKKGLRLDSGGIAKGLALDQAVEVLKRNGVTAAVLHAGTSSVYALGAPPGHDGWTVRIRDPYNTKAWIDEVILKDQSLSTSGSYEKFFEIQGSKYCHIFDPATGMPVKGMLSATAIAPTAMESDALSTAFFVMGVKGTEAYCRAHPRIRGILVPDTESGRSEPVRVNFPAEAEKE